MRDPRIGDERRLDCFVGAFEQLLGLNLGVHQTVLDRAAALLLDSLDLDRIDILTQEAESDSLIAVASSSTPLGRWRYGTGIRRLALVHGGPVVEAFQSGRAYIAGQAAPGRAEGATPATDPEPVSLLVCPIQADGVGLGVICAASTGADHFSRADLSFLEAVGRWLGLVLDRAALRRQRDARPQAGTIDEVTRRRLDDLTPRQREVVELISSGLTNEQIARKLAVGPGTVDARVRRILSRLGVRSRKQVAALAVGIRLLEPAGRRDSHG